MVTFLGNTLFYPGCILQHKLEKLSANYELLLRQFGINFITSKEVACCGAPMLYAGYKDDFNEHQEKVLEALKKNNIKHIITACPSCARMFTDEYRIKAQHITQVLHDNMRKIKKDYQGEKICYHDPCELGRKLGVYNEPREILKKIGFEVVEFSENKKDAMCCGAGGLLKANSPRAADRIALLRLKQARARKVVTTCPLCYMHLKKNAEGTGIEVLEFSEVLI